MTLILENQVARRAVLTLQGLADPPHLRLSQDALRDLLVRLGFVQMDSIRWVERAHHMILYARNQTYRPKMLERLHEKDGWLFENWTHDASLIPVDFYPYWKHKFRRHRQQMELKFERWQGAGFVEHIPELLARIEAEGQIMSRDLEKPQSDGPKEMWQWHDGKAALEFLWRTGRVAVPARKGFQKCYDLCSRVIPEAPYRAEVNEAEFVDWACRSALERLGFGSAGDIARYWDLVSIGEVNQWLETEGNGQYRDVEIVCADRKTRRKLLARPDIEDVVSKLPEPPARLRALSPFDPVIRDRNRLSWLFGFEYRIEIYVPPEKRQYGYYVFPLLEGDRLVGRIDMQAVRANNCLAVKKLWLEPKVRWSAGRAARLESELVRQARLSGVGDYHFDPSMMA